MTRPGLRQWRTARRMTQADLAEALGVTDMTVQRYERAFGDPMRRIPSIEMMETIAKLTAGDVLPEDFYPPHLRREGWWGNIPLISENG